MSRRPPAGPVPARGAPRGPRRVVGQVRRVVAGRTVRVLFVVAAVALGAHAVAVQWPAVRDSAAAFGPVALGGALVAVVAGLLATMQVWRVLLAAFGSPLPIRPAARIFFVAQLGKYLPGSIWPVLAQMELARAQQVPRSRSAAVAAVTVLLSLTAGLLTAAVAAPLLPATVSSGYRWMFLLVVPGLVVLHPRVVNPVLGWILRRTGRAGLPAPLTGRQITLALGWAVLSWLLLGVHVWLLVLPLGVPAGPALPLAVGGFALAWGAGFLVVLAPAGAGIRELLLVAALGTVLPVGAATAVALTSRLAMTVGDLLLAGAAAGRSRRSRPPVQPATNSPSGSGPTG